MLVVYGHISGSLSSLSPGMGVEGVVWVEYGWGHPCREGCMKGGVEPCFGRGNGSGWGHELSLVWVVWVYLVKEINKKQVMYFAKGFAAHTHTPIPRVTHSPRIRGQHQTRCQCG
jgi:hypothetical protein